jgi:hypothetical protein
LPLEFLVWHSANQWKEKEHQLFTYSFKKVSDKTSTSGFEKTEGENYIKNILTNCKKTNKCIWQAQNDDNSYLEEIGDLSMARIHKCKLMLCGKK